MPSIGDLNDDLNIDLRAMEILLLSKAEKTSITIEEFIQLALLNGSTKEDIKRELTRDLLEGGRIFSEFNSAIKATSNGVVNRVRDSATFYDFGVDQQYRWIAVMVNTCPDCIDRHGSIRTYDEWLSFGLPRTGYTRCKENCKCILLPSKLSELEPIDRKNK